MDKETLRATGKHVHDTLRFNYNTWCELQKIAGNMGCELDEKTGKLIEL